MTPEQERLLNVNDTPSDVAGEIWKGRALGLSTALRLKDSRIAELEAALREAQTFIKSAAGNKRNFALWDEGKQKMSLELYHRIDRILTKEGVKTDG